MSFVLFVGFTRCALHDAAENVTGRALAHTLGVALQLNPRARPGTALNPSCSPRSLLIELVEIERTIGTSALKTLSSGSHRRSQSTLGSPNKFHHFGKPRFGMKPFSRTFRILFLLWKSSTLAKFRTRFVESKLKTANRNLSSKIRSNVRLLTRCVRR